MRYMRGSNLLIGIGVASTLMGVSPATQAGPEILCSTMQVVECEVDISCEKVSPLTADVPVFLRLNLEQKQVQTIREGDRKQTTVIQGMARSDGLIFLQGVEPAREGERGALGWTMSVDESDGRMVITASGRGVGYTLFGACTSVD